jgi:mannose-6-phosphate isomerase-like protein (cupin superfamily)
MPITHVPKPLGSEEIWAQTDSYVGKILYINPHSKLSLQFHNLKTETIRVISGRLYLHYQPASSEEVIVKEMVEGDVFHVPSKLIHRFEAREERVQLVEVSTPELWDVVRLSDDYNRNTVDANP